MSMAASRGRRHATFRPGLATNLGNLAAGCDNRGWIGQAGRHRRGDGPMPVEFVSGDPVANRFKAQALAHGCNCQGSMGAGIAKGFRDRYPAMYEEYRRCKAEYRRFNLGDAWLWKSDGRPWVFNLGTQE